MKLAPALVAVGLGAALFGWLFHPQYLSFDSYHYMVLSHRPQVGNAHPLGYGFLLRAMAWLTRELPRGAFPYLYQAWQVLCLGTLLRATGIPFTASWKPRFGELPGWWRAAFLTIAAPFVLLAVPALVFLMNGYWSEMTGLLVVAAAAMTLERAALSGSRWAWFGFAVACFAGWHVRYQLIVLPVVGLVAVGCGVRRNTVQRSRLWAALLVSLAIFGAILAAQRGMRSLWSETRMAEVSAGDFVQKSLACRLRCRVKLYERDCSSRSGKALIEGLTCTDLIAEQKSLGRPLVDPGDLPATFRRVGTLGTLEWLVLAPWTYLGESYFTLEHETFGFDLNVRILSAAQDALAPYARLLPPTGTPPSRAFAAILAYLTSAYDAGAFHWLTRLSLVVAALAVVRTRSTSALFLGLMAFTSYLTFSYLQPKAPLRYLVTIGIPGLLSGWGALLHAGGVRAAARVDGRGTLASGALNERVRSAYRQLADRVARLEPPETRGRLQASHSVPTHWMVVAVATVAVWGALMSFPEACSGRFLDQDWSLTLGYLMKTRSQAGVDYVFTYGPLGYLTDSLFYPGLFGLKYVWAIACAAVSAVALVRFATVLPSRLLQVSWLWLVLAILPRSEAQPIVVLVVLALLHLVEDAWSPRRLAFTAAFLATLSLAKFTFLLLAVGLIVILGVAGPRGSKSRVGVALAGFYLASLAALWLLAGQSLSHVPRYLATSFEIARGYSEGMSFDGAPKFLATASPIAIALAAGASLVPPATWGSRRRLAGLGIVALGLFLSWKEGFVRQDPQHTVVFFGYAAIATILLAALHGGRESTTLPLRAAFLVVAALESVGVLRAIAEEPPLRAFSLASTRERAARSFEILWHPLRHREAVEAVWRTQQKAWALPAVQARVGRESLDTMTLDQSVVLLNGFNWHPRPVFQSYSAYTPKLAQLNGQFFRREDAPRYVLTRWLSIDRRFPADDDGPALIELLRRYRPVLSERDYILLERLPAAEIGGGPGSTVLHRRLEFDQRLRLSLDPRDLHTLSVVVRPTLAGKLRRLLFRAPRLVFVVEQGNRERERKRYELVPDLAAVPFVLSPLFEGNFDVPLVYSGNGRRIVGIRFVGTRDLREAFGDAVEITIRRYPGVAPAR